LIRKAFPTCQRADGERTGWTEALVAEPAARAQSVITKQERPTMNVFASSNCPREAARNLDDRRVVMQVAETAQLLSTATRLLAPEEAGRMPLYPNKLEQHPVAEWVRSSWEAFNYTLEHGLALHREYCERFPRRTAIHSGAVPIHAVLGASRSVVQPRMFRPLSGPLPCLLNHAVNLSVGLDFRGVEVTAAYRMYLAARWRLARRDGHQVTWTGRSVPEWFAKYDLMALEFVRGQSQRGGKVL
jgi:hypothetical protein